MIIHAVELLDDEVDFSQYDTDGDGFVDNVYVFYAGRGEADGGVRDGSAAPDFLFGRKHGGACGAWSESGYQPQLLRRQ